MMRTNKRDMLLAVGILAQSCLFILILGGHEFVEAWNTMDRWTSHAPKNEMASGFQTMDTLGRKRDHILCNNEHPRRISKERSRRNLLVASISILSSTILQTPLEPFFARNLPISNGADTSKSGSVQALLPILKLRNTLKDLQRSLQQEHEHSTNADHTSSTSIISRIPPKESEFKRLFDAYSDQVSYKQKFLDQNAFLVYYTQGYDGPGRKKMEDDIVNERQTLQFGARNDAWMAWESFVAEQDYYQKRYGDLSTTAGNSRQGEEEKEDFSQLMEWLSEAIQAMDMYLKLSPQQDVTATEELLSSNSW
jgi:hypothetical protein